MPVPRFVADALLDHIATYVDPTDPSAFVFTSPTGQPIRASLFRRRAWAPACVATGLGTITKVAGHDHYEGLRLHDLRHTAVALWIAAGASPKELAVRAGHTSVSVVLDRYGHLLPGHEDKVNAALDAFANEAHEAAQPATVLDLPAR
ncbi:MAG: tyrosine-type recombinase/integrase [Actinomycetota bacterium]|nr:tyrosine-type recombinase/integrase [Actinomycetota bacterium]